MTVVNTTPPTYYGLSTETKPTVNVPGGSAWIEEDTSKTFLFNEDTQQWYEFGNAGGGGGGESGIVIVTMTDNDPGFTPDKTFEEVAALYESGKVVLFRVVVPLVDGSDLYLPQYDGNSFYWANTEYYGGDPDSEDDHGCIVTTQWGWASSDGADHFWYNKFTFNADAYEYWDSEDDEDEP